MDYFVSVESGYYHQWQLELLIESFRLKNLDSKLVVAVAESDQPFEDSLQLANENIRSIERIFSHKNFGQEYNHLPLNKIYGLLTALRSGVLSSPFVVIEPDMLLVSPIDVMENQIQFHVSKDFPLSLVEKHIPLSDFIVGEWDYFPVGSVYAFQDVEIDFFESVLSLYHKFLEHTDWKEMARVAWMLSFLRKFGEYSFGFMDHYEGHMLQNKLNFNFIHYTHGVPPTFSKALYRSSGDINLAGCMPYELLLKVNPTPVTNYAQEIVRSYIKRVLNEREKRT